LDEECDIYGNVERRVQGFGGETWGDYFEDLGIDEMKLKWIFKRGVG